MSPDASLSLDAFLSAASIQQFTWLPDGSALIFTRDCLDTGTREVFSVDPSGHGEATRLTGTFQPPHQTSPLADRAEPKSALSVSGDGSRIFFTSSRYYQAIDNIFSMRPDGSDVAQHTFHDAIIETAPAPSPDGSTLAYFTRTARGTKVLLLDLREGRAWPRQMSTAAEADRKPAWSPDGRWLSFERGGTTWVHELATGQERPLTDGSWGKVGDAVWSPDSTRVAVLSEGSGFAQVAVVSVESGHLTPLTRSPREHRTPSWSPDGSLVTFTVTDGVGLSNQVAVTAASGGDYQILTSGRALREMPRFAPDGSSIYYLDGASNRVTDIWSVPSGGGAARQITNSMGSLDPARLAVAEEMSYPAPDNLPIRTLVLKPADFDPDRKYPVVLALHGHPSQWNHSINLLWQWVVSRGVVLVAPNPRGSVGMGRAFHDLHEGDFGGDEFTDVMAALDLLKQLPYVDYHRKATWGGSGGGYMSLLIATKAPQVFDAQIIRAPVSAWKWLAMDRYTGQARYATAKRDPQRAREEMGGSYTDIADRYEERSPLNHVENVTVPQLLMHARRDGSVPINESRRWVERMHDLGKADLIDYVEYADDDHSLLRYRSTMRDQGERIVRFLAKHLDVPELVDGGL